MTFARIAAPAAVLSAFLAAPVMAQDVAFDLINNSSATLMEFYASPVDVGSWEEDILGAEVLPPGGGGTVTIADGSAQCAYDALFIFEDGSEMQDVIDVCATASYTITD